MQINDNYVTEAPSHANAAALFAGKWASQVPGLENVTGTIGLFDDARVKWLVENRGRFDGQTVLELGPLEGGHSWMLEQAGADVLAIEANSHAYLKCLIAKEALGMSKVRFLLGDFDKMLDDTTERFDFILASGVLYHMADPFRTLHNMMRCTDELLIWSHFFDEEAMPPGDPRRQAFSGETFERELDGGSMTYHARFYGDVEAPTGFIGGIMNGSVWLERPQTIAVLQRNGFEVTSFYEHLDHPHGPSACLYARRA